MWMRDAFSQNRRRTATVQMHIYEKKKRGQRSYSPASSFSKYANSNSSRLASREVCQ